MIKIDLITGFLGAGKTTFILKYAKYFLDKGLKVGILEYDYGAVNVDIMLLSGLRGENCELEMVAAGCDKDCLKRRFKTKLISMAMCGYDRIIVEPSGIFDMDDFFDCLREEPLDRFYEIGSVLAIVGADLPDNCEELADYMLASQVAGAGKVIISKSQLYEPFRIEKVKLHIEDSLRRIGCNKDTKELYFIKCFDEMTADDIYALSVAGYRILDYVKNSMAGNEFSSVPILNHGLTRSEAHDKIKDIFESGTFGQIWRIKGFARDNDSYYQLNATADGISCEQIADGQEVIIITGASLDERAILDFVLN